MFELKDDGTDDPLDISQESIRFFYENNEAFRRMWHAYKAAGQRLNVLETMPSPYIQVELEMQRRRQAALAEQLADLVRRRRSTWKASPGEARTGTAVSGAATGGLSGRLHPGSTRTAAMAWNKSEG